MKKITLQHNNAKISLLLLCLCTTACTQNKTTLSMQNTDNDVPGAIAEPGPCILGAEERAVPLSRIECIIRRDVQPTKDAEGKQYCPDDLLNCLMESHRVEVSEQLKESIKKLIESVTVENMGASQEQLLKHIGDSENLANYALGLLETCSQLEVHNRIEMMKAVVKKFPQFQHHMAAKGLGLLIQARPNHNALGTLLDALHR